MSTANRIGDIGERLFSLIISRNYKFQPVQLGEKYPNVDFFVELLGHSQPYYFLVQIKSTERGVNRNNKLRISIPKSKVNILAKYSCPTYLVGVDIITDKAYIYPVNKPTRNNFSSFPTNKILDINTLDNLFKDVVNFWQNANIQKSKYHHKL